MQPNYEHDRRFDFLRGLAALMVFVDHSYFVCVSPFIPGYHPVKPIFAFMGEHAVLVFFLLSGFLVTLSILFNIQKNGRFSVRQYVISRVARIYPPLLGAIAFCTLAYLIIEGLGLPGSSANKFGFQDLVAARNYFTVTANEIWLALTMRNGLLQVDGPLWSLNIEVIDYVAALFVCLLIKADNIYVRIGSFVALGLVLRYGQHINEQFFFYTSIWTLGAVFAMWAFHGFTRGVAGMAIVFGSALASAFLFFDHDGQFLKLAICFGYAVAIFVLPFPKSLLRISPLSQASNYSYTLYVMHFPILLFFSALLQNVIGKSLPSFHHYGHGSVFLHIDRRQLVSPIFGK